jgi:hypothetical protein
MSRAPRISKITGFSPLTSAKGGGWASSSRWNGGGTVRGPVLAFMQGAAIKIGMTMQRRMYGLQRVTMSCRTNPTALSWMASIMTSSVVRPAQTTTSALSTVTLHTTQS